MSLFASVVPAQEGPIADPAQIAFEEGRWVDAIDEYREILAALPDNRLAWLRIAQAQRELGRFDEALASLDLALANQAPEAMVHFERARNLIGLGQTNNALDELEEADHLELRARVLLEDLDDFDAIRDSRRFERIYEHVRSRVFPCEGVPEASQFDFWLGRWDVRGPGGAPLGQSTVSKSDGGCAVTEQWEGTAGSSGTSMTFYLPSRGQWRQVWVGSGGTHIDMAGRFEDGEMHLEGTIEYFDPEDVVAFRSTWTIGANGLVRQLMEQFDLVSQTWQIWFDGIYRPLE